MFYWFDALFREGRGSLKNVQFFEWNEWLIVHVLFPSRRIWLWVANEAPVRATLTWTFDDLSLMYRDMEKEKKKEKLKIVEEKKSLFGFWTSEPRPV